MIDRARRLIILCNALDDATRLDRQIVTDSPAASRKIFLAATATRLSGVRSLVISMGRGRADGSGRAHPAKAVRHDGVPILYAPFSNRKFISQLRSFTALAALLWRVRKFPGRTTLVFYNQLPAYFLALCLGRMLGFRAVLDLEDGAVNAGRTRRSTFDLIRRLPFEWACDRALLACSALRNYTRLRPTLCYYGTIDELAVTRDWSSPVVTVLFGGTIDKDTGVDLLIDAITGLRDDRPAWAKSLVIEVTGKGSGIGRLADLAASAVAPRVIVHGRTNDAEYRTIVQRCHVGLALKPNFGLLAQTTFPSKVIEMAGAGMLVVSTDISDVRRLLGNGCRYIETDDPKLLITVLHEIVENRESSRLAASVGHSAVIANCSLAGAGKVLSAFLFPEFPQVN